MPNNQQYENWLKSRSEENNGDPFLRNVTMPNSQKYEDWIKDR
jgi:hypothetical protein